jgi:hypothetical protein
MGVPMTPPWPYRMRVVLICDASNDSFSRNHGNALASSLGDVGFPLPHCREGFEHGSASGRHARLPSHAVHSLQGSC